MNIFEVLVLNCIFILFPLLIYLFYIAYNKNVGRKENDLFLDFALFTSLYLCLKYGVSQVLSEQAFILNVILIVSLSKKRIYTSFLITLCIGLYYNKYFDMNMVLFILEYVYYFIIYYILNKKEINKYRFIDIFCFSKAFWLLIQCYLLNNKMISGDYKLLKIVFLVSILYVITYTIVMLFEKGEEIFKYHMNVKELEQEKQIKASLFKITHEIKNPIAVCKGYLDMFDVNNIDHAKRYVPILKEEIKKTLFLLQDFLAINKIKIEKDVVDINFLLENVFKNFYLMLNEKNIKFVDKMIDDEIFIEGDYNRLTQVIINVVKNAIEAMEEKNDGVITLNEKINKNSIHILIEDSGMGMNAEELTRVKEAFFTTKRNGTGLGISLSNEIVKAHGGEMIYHSKINCGTKVEIVLPIKNFS